MDGLKEDPGGDSVADPPDGTKCKKECAEVESDLANIKTILRKGHDIVLTVRLESQHPGRRRYLVAVSAPPTTPEFAVDELDLPVQLPSQGVAREHCLIGVDSSSSGMGEGDERKLTVGFVAKMLWGTKVVLDGDGGFSIHQLGKLYIFKPVSVQALWTAIQTLNMVLSTMTPKRNSLGDVDWDWVKVYRDSITSPQSCINEWNAMPDLLVKRPLTPGELTFMTEDESNREMKKTLITSTLREIMKNVDLDEITSKSIRMQLEKDMGQSLEGFKSFIDEETLLILGQMDPASKMFDFLYLGSEWNASNLEELHSNGITHILNVTREIDNFFPAVFQYLNIREYDEETTDLLKYWNKTYHFINDAKELGGNVLVHCKMGISRSASTVVAFTMKFFKWNLEDTLEYVTKRRPIVNPNKGFRHQLQVYEGILEAFRHRNTYRKVYRSKSESNLKFSSSKEEGEILRKEPPVERRVKSMHARKSKHKFLSVPNSNLVPESGGDDQSTFSRPKSWSPPSKVANYLLAAAGNMDQPQACQTIKGCDKTSKEERKEPIVCHCYSKLAQYYSQNLRHLPSEHCDVVHRTLEDNEDDEGRNVPNNDGGERFRQLLQNAESRVAQHGREVGKSGEEAKEVKSAKCPAKTHIKQCTCNFEVELEVLEDPVNILEEDHSVETDVILKNLGNFPIHMRQSQQWKSSTTTSSSPNEDQPIYNLPVSDTVKQFSETPNDHDNVNDTVINLVDANNEDVNTAMVIVDNDSDGDDDLVVKEELSVKTLADMFDYRIGGLPAKPPKTKPTASKLRNAKIDEIARKLTNAEDCSEC